MPLKSGSSDLIHDFYDMDDYPADPAQARGRLIIATGTLTNAADDSTGSKYHLVDLPSSCILHFDTFFDVAADGVAQSVIGTETDTDALVDVLKSAGNLHSPIAKGDPNHGKRLWEVLGLAKDPCGNIGLWKHAEADAVAAGSMPFQIHYITA